MKYLTVFLLSVMTYGFSQENIAPKVVAIYPAADSIPVNILRFYIQFSRPMQEMNILDHVHLINHPGKDMTGVFYENQYELWNESRTMVTLIVDPGRVKTGLLANNKMGRAFHESEQYTLRVDSLLLGFENNKLSNSYSKKYVAIAEDKTAPNTDLWQCSKPTKGTKEPMNIAFRDCIDVISAHTYIKILSNEKEVYGKISLSKNGENWSFEPEKNWQKGTYKIIVHPALEDIAANSLNQVFEHQSSEYKTEKRTQTLKFQIE